MTYIKSILIAIMIGNRSTDTRIRREVLGQMLDYAANAVAYWPIEDLQSYFEDRCEKDGTSSEEELEILLSSTDEIDNYWKQVKTNLQAGRIRMVFVADEIPTELRRIVEFLNEQMDPAEVLSAAKTTTGSERRSSISISATPGPIPRTFPLKAFFNRS